MLERRKKRGGLFAGLLKKYEALLKRGGADAGDLKALGKCLGRTTLCQELTVSCPRWSAVDGRGDGRVGAKMSAPGEGVDDGAGRRGPGQGEEKVKLA